MNSIISPQVSRRNALKLAGAAGLGRQGAGQRQAAIGEAQADLGRDRDGIAHGAVHRRHHATDSSRVAQQGGAAVVAVDQLGGAAEVEVDAGGAERQGLGRVGGQRLGVRAQQLQVHRHAAGGGQGGGEKLGAVLVKDPGRQACIHDAHELGDRPVEARLTGQQGPGVGIDDPFHGGQSEPAWRLL